jgi:LPXTG-motif cell wall-anchored protein
VNLQYLASRCARSSAVAVATALLISGTFVGGAHAAQPPNPAPGCTGGAAPNPSVEETSSESTRAIDGYLVAGSPDATLTTDDAYPYDGDLYAVLATPTGEVSTAYLDIPYVVPGGVYDLTVWAGTHDLSLDQPIGLRAYDSENAKIAEVAVEVDHDVDLDDELGRLDLPSLVLPADTASLVFFAETNGDRVKWDCVFLNVASYDLVEQVQDPVTSEWGPVATLVAGSTANYRTVVRNGGTRPLSDLTLSDPWCGGPPTRAESELFDLAVMEERTFTCNHPNVAVEDDGHVNTATVPLAHYPGGTLPTKSAISRIFVLAAPVATTTVPPVQGAAPPPLASTGATTVGSLVMAALLVIAGTFLVIVFRRRRKDEDA